MIRDMDPETATLAAEADPEEQVALARRGQSAAEQQLYERERTQFRALILANPNYFGNLTLSPFTPVLSIQGNTAYEEIGCVGYQPQFRRLEAVVYVKQPSGYGGDICSDGTQEYVRFYSSFDNGVTWNDLGLTSFTAYNIPEGTAGAKRLEYAITRSFDPSKTFCFVNRLALVRAVLSWNVPPPPNDPGFVPVWGNVHNTHVQIDPFKLIVVGDLLTAAKATLTPELLASVDVTQTVPAAEPKELSLAERQERYRDKGVEPHRYAMPEIQQLMSPTGLSESLMAPGAQSPLAKLGVIIGDLSILFPTDGSKRYEELECIGLNARQDALAGVIRIKRPFGYGGSLCEAGSTEFVTFWADFNKNGVFETCLGTTSVNVYDINNIPAEGLEYAIFLPIDLNKYRKPCHQGPVVVPVRAILSWNVPPPCGNPNYVPIWGNREETLVHIYPGQPSIPGVHNPIIQTVGSMRTETIDPVTGLANGSAELAGFSAQDSPFGGLVVLTGHIADPPDVSSGAAKLRYRVEISNDNGLTWEFVTNSFSLGLDQLLNGIWSPLPNVIQSVDGDGFYAYQEDLKSDGPGNAMIYPVGNILARWQTGGKTGLWRLRIRVKNPGIGPDWFSNVVAVRLDNAAPVPSITITSGGGECADFGIGDVISGTYSVSDQHFGRLRFLVLPPEIGGNPTGGSFTAPAPLPPGSTMPLARTYAGGAPTTGEAGSWSLDTTGMPQCGYVVELWAADRTIVNSGGIGFQARDVVGLCLREAE